jgi:hypothetical protein
LKVRGRALTRETAACQKGAQRLPSIDDLHPQPQRRLAELDARGEGRGGTLERRAHALLAQGQAAELPRGRPRLGAHEQIVVPAIAALVLRSSRWPSRPVPPRRRGQMRLMMDRLGWMMRNVR